MILGNYCHTCVGWILLFGRHLGKDKIFQGLREKVAVVLVVAVVVQHSSSIER